MIPTSWIETTLGSVVDYGATIKVEAVSIENDAWILELEDIDKNSSKLNKRATFSDRKSKSTKNKFSEGDVLYGKLRPYLNKTLLADKDGYCSTEIIPIKTSKHIHNRYLHYSMKRKKFLDYVESASHGMSMPRLGTKQGQAAPFVLAPLNEQIRIANKLDSILAKVDKAQARLDKIPAILKRFRQSVLAAATSGELTKEWREENAPIKHSEVTGKYALDWSIVEESALPESWQWVPLGNYAKCNRGKFSIRPRNDPSCFDGDYPFIQIGDLPRQGGFIYSHKQTLNEKGYSVSREFDAGTVVLAIVGATIANTGITTYPVCFPDSLVGINSASETTNKYLDYHLRAIKEDIRQASYAGGGQPNIKLTMVNPLPLPLPSEAEIVEIVAKVELLMARANKVEKQYFDAKARLDRLTQSILAKAFRGELVPQDPNDEPAEKLLERILAEKEQSEPKKTTLKRTTNAKTAEKE